MSRDNLLYSALKEQQLYNALKELVTIYDFENDPQRLIRTPKDIKNAWIDARQALSTYESSADSTEGIRWVKASERMPDKGGLYHFRTTGGLNDVVFYKDDIGFYKAKLIHGKPDKYRQNATTELIPVPYKKEEIEWLDESNPPTQEPGRDFPNNWLNDIDKRIERLANKSPKPSTIQGEGEVDWEKAAMLLYEKHNPSTNVDTPIGQKIFAGFLKDMHFLESKFPPHPQPTVTQQGEGEVPHKGDRIMQEQYKKGYADGWSDCQYNYSPKKQ